MAVATATKATKQENQQRWEEMAAAWNGKHHRQSHFPARNDLPGAFEQLFAEGKFGDEVMDKDLLTVAMGDAWTAAEYPSLAVETWNWESYFEAAGFIENGLSAAYPDDMPVLYRASVRDVIGMSWTDSLETAQWFHARNVPAGHDAVILRHDDVAYYEVLARFHGGESRDEAEWVLSAEATDGATELD